MASRLVKRTEVVVLDLDKVTVMLVNASHCQNPGQGLGSSDQNPA
jgi:hypothetical protein